MTDTASLDAYTSEPNVLARHYSRFRVSQRLLLTGHSHQAWPDVALDGQLEAVTDAAEAVDDKWTLAFAKADEVRAGYRRLLGDPDGEIALAAGTHELVVRFLSCLDLRRRPRLVTSDGEFHSVRRQLARLTEEGVEVVAVPTEPVDTLAARLADQVDDRTSAVLISAVLFETAWVVPDLGALAAACRPAEVELLVDAYHALGPVPFPLHDLGLGSAWVTGGGYKYLQLGEGNCFLRLPPQAEQLRPVITGWFAEFEEVTGRSPAPAREADAPYEIAPPAGATGAPSGEAAAAAVPYGPGANRFAGSTYDPTSHYRAARVMAFWAEQGLTPSLLHRLYQHQVGTLARLFDQLDVPDEVVTRDRVTPLSGFGGFLTLRSHYTPQLQEALRDRGVSTDHRGHHLRLGPAPYLTDAQLEAAMAALADALRPHLRSARS